MKTAVLLFTAAVAATSVTSSYAAEILIGTVAAFNHQKNTIVLTDKTVYTFKKDASKIPAELKAGDRIELTVANDGADGYGGLVSIKILQ